MHTGPFPRPVPQVYRAELEGEGPVAVKVLQESVVQVSGEGGEDAAAALLNEAAILLRCAHENVIGLYGGAGRGEGSWGSACEQRRSGTGPL